jgi:hypothetical protein
MQNREDIQNLAARLEALHSGLRDEEPTLDGMVSKVTEAWALYRGFRKHFAGNPFDVRTLQRDASGTIVEKPFDWQALDRVASRP